MNGTPAWAHTVAAFVGRVPSGVWVGLAILNLVVTIASWSTARRRIRRAGQRAVDAELVHGVARSKDTALTIASMIPAGLFWAMVLAGSFHGLIAFGRQVLGWHGGWEYLVPGTLYGVSVTFEDEAGEQRLSRYRSQPAAGTLCFRNEATFQSCLILRCSIWLRSHD